MGAWGLGLGDAELGGHRAEGCRAWGLGTHGSKPLGSIHAWGHRARPLGTRRLVLGDAGLGVWGCACVSGADAAPVPWGGPKQPQRHRRREPSTRPAPVPCSQRPSPASPPPRALRSPGPAPPCPWVPIPYFGVSPLAGPAQPCCASRPRSTGLSRDGSADVSHFLHFFPHSSLRGDVSGK